MSTDPIAHLDPHETTPFDVIVALDQALMVYRAALATQLQTLTYDAIRDSSESSLMLAGQLLWDARDALVACVETDA